MAAGFELTRPGALVLMTKKCWSSLEGKLVDDHFDSLNALRSIMPHCLAAPPQVTRVRAWSEGSVLAVEDNAELPQRCIKCNGDQNCKPVSATFQQGMLDSSLDAPRRVRVTYYLCGRHHLKKIMTRAIPVAVFGSLLGAIAICANLSQSAFVRALPNWLCIIVVLCVPISGVAMFITYIWTANDMRRKGFSGSVAYLSGVNSDFLQRLGSRPDNARDGRPMAAANRGSPQYAPTADYRAVPPPLPPALPTSFQKLKDAVVGDPLAQQDQQTLAQLDMSIRADIRRGIPLERIAASLEEVGWTRAEAAAAVVKTETARLGEMHKAAVRSERAIRKAGQNRATGYIVTGLIMVVVGLVATIGSFLMAPRGGYFIITWGLIVFGAVRLFKGLMYVGPRNGQ